MKIRFESKVNNDATRVGGMKVSYAPAKRAIARWRWYLVLVVAASPLLLFLGKLLLDLAVVEAPGEVSLPQVTVNAPLPGLVTHLVLKAGDSVTTGELLVSLTDPQLVERHRVLLAERKALDHETMPQSGQAVALAERVERRQAANVAVIHRLMTQGAATRAELAAAQARQEAAERDLILARRAAESAAKPPPSVYVRKAQLTAELATIQERLSHMRVMAPISGIVVDVLASPGQALASGAPILVISEHQPCVIKAYLAPSDINKISLGSKARVRFKDGTMVRAEIISASEITERMPPTMRSTFSSPEQVVSVTLKPLVPLPERLTRLGMPCTVYLGVRLPF
jgi:multidrug efflux system membrane fusion protein